MGDADKSRNLELRFLSSFSADPKGKKERKARKEGSERRRGRGRRGTEGKRDARAKKHHFRENSQSDRVHRVSPGLFASHSSSPHPEVRALPDFLLPPPRSSPTFTIPRPPPRPRRPMSAPPTPHGGAAGSGGAAPPGPPGGSHRLHPPPAPPGPLLQFVVHPLPGSQEQLYEKLRGVAERINRLGSSSSSGQDRSQATGLSSPSSTPAPGSSPSGAHGSLVNVELS